MVATRSQKRKADDADIFTGLPIPQRKPRRKRGRCMLLELPPELRNHIYELSLKDAIPAIINLGSFGQPSITRTSKQLRDEIMPMVLELISTRDWHLPLRVPSVRLEIMHAHLRLLPDAQSSRYYHGYLVLGTSFTRRLAVSATPLHTSPWTQRPSVPSTRAQHHF